MENNIASSALVVAPADNINDLAEQYHDSLFGILDQHAPLITKTIRVRPNTPWLNEDIKQAESERRRRWGSGGVHGWPQMLSSSRSSDTVYARCLTRQRRLSTMTRSQRVVKMVNLCSGSWIIFLDVGTSHTCLIWIQQLIWWVPLATFLMIKLSKFVRAWM